MLPLSRASRPRLPDPLLALLIQALAWPVVATFAAGQGGWSLPAALAQGAAAAAMSRVMTMAPWWVGLQLALPLAAWSLLALDIPPVFFLGAAGALFLVYRAPLRHRVPLFLSSRQAWEVVGGLLPPDRGVRIVDLGSGLGGGLAILAKRFPLATLEGYENAPLPWIASRIRLARFGRRCTVHGRSLWHADLSRCDVAYAFLSPVPMARIWSKVQAEMPAGSLFVSNRFPVPGIAPERVMVAAGAPIYVYRVAKD